MEVHTFHITTSTVSLHHPIMIDLDPARKHVIAPNDGVEALINLDPGDL